MAYWHEVYISTGPYKRSKEGGGGRTPPICQNFHGYYCFKVSVKKTRIILIVLDILILFQMTFKT